MKKTTTRSNRLIIVFVLLGLFGFSRQLHAQSGLAKQWDKTIGGSADETLTSIIQTSDGGYILGGNSASGITGNKSQASNGGNDYWVVKLDASGNKTWDKTFGGSSTDQLGSLQQTSDGGYILGGVSTSPISGDKSQTSQGGIDYWVVKLDASGNKTWDKTFGGSSTDQLGSLQQTSDGGYILGGWSNSTNDGDKSQANNGGQDYWVVKLDASGNKTWDKTFGGSGVDILTSLQQTSDGGYILGGYSSSGISVDKSQASKGVSDYWIVKLDASGNKTWDKTYGGSAPDFLTSLQQTSDGGYILGGYSQSGITGDKSQASKGVSDYWIVKLDASGNKTWDKDFGGSSIEQLASLQQTSDGGYIMGGYSQSGISGDKSQGSQGGQDYWVVKLNSSGNKTWDKDFGGSSTEQLASLQQTSDGGYILGGSSSSGITGDKSQASQGGYDYWAVKLAAEDPLLNVWAGNISNSWSNTGNWSGNIVPISTSEVTIPSGVSNYPSITTGTISLKNITIASGATLTQTGGTFDISGTFTNNGTFSQTGGEVIFSSASAQTIPGGTYFNLTLNGAGTKSLSVNATVNGAFTINTGSTFSQTAGILTLNGNATNTGNANLTGGEIAFNATSGTQTVPALIYNNLTISGGGTKTLQGDATVNGILNFTGGTLTTLATSNTLTLGNTATITETGTSFFKGKLIKAVAISGAGTTTFGGMGVSFDNTDGGNWGTVTLTRTSDAAIGNNQGIKRYWNISPTSPAGTNVNVTFTWPTAEDNGLVVSSKAQVWKSEDNGATWETADDVADIFNGTGVRSISATTNSFSLWTVSEMGKPLPVSWLYFNGKNTGSGTELTWATATEKNSAYFVVVRSENAKNFEEIGRVNAAGNSNQQLVYSITDKKPLVAAKTYYRLKQTDLDGTFAYSEMIVVKNSHSGFEASAYPNPFGEVLHLQTSATEKIRQIVLLSIEGKEVYRKNINQTTDLILTDLPVLKSGMYFLRLIGDNGTATLKVNRQ